MPGAQERLCELREEAYCKVLKCFVASQSYDLVSFPAKLAAHTPVLQCECNLQAI